MRDDDTDEVVTDADLEKAGPPTEASVRDGLRTAAAALCAARDLTAELPAEIGALACVLTEVPDPVRAVRELVEDALARRARVTVLNFIASQPRDRDDVDESLTKKGPPRRRA